MLRIKSSSRFRKDFRRLAKSGKDMTLLYDVIKMLQEQKQLPYKYKDHALTGDWKGYRDCHIQPDWLLIYRIDHNDLILELTRTGSHSDLLE